MGDLQNYNKIEFNFEFNQINNLQKIIIKEINKQNMCQNYQFLF